MKTKWLVVAGIALVLLMAGLVGCSADGTSISGGDFSVKLNSQQEGIWVSGQGEVTAVPDVAILSLGIQAQEASVAEAQAQAANAMEKVMAALEEQGVDEKDIQTQNFSIQKVSRWDNDREQEIVLGYRVTNTVTAKIRDVEKAGTAIDAVAAAGGDLTVINGISFTVDDPTEYYELAREKAVADAAAKAKKMADLAGVKLGNPTYITESSYTPAPIYRDAVAYAEEGKISSTTPVSPGELEITTNVQMAYAID